MIANGITKHTKSRYFSMTFICKASVKPFAFSIRAIRRAFNCSGVMVVVVIGICVFCCIVMVGGASMVAVWARFADSDSSFLPQGIKLPILSFNLFLGMRFFPPQNANKIKNFSNSNPKCSSIAPLLHRKSELKKGELSKDKRLTAHDNSPQNEIYS